MNVSSPSARRRGELGVRLIVAYKAVKAMAEVAIAVALVVAATRGEIESLRSFAQHLERNVAARWSVLAGRALARLVSDRGVHFVEVGLALDGILSAIEGWSLWQDYSWGPWLVVVATGAPLPLEAAELVRHPSALRTVVALLNVAVVCYLARRIFRGRGDRSA